MTKTELLNSGNNEIKTGKLVFRSEAKDAIMQTVGMIEYIKGDVLQAKEPYIAHGVNCKGVMGKGVALSIKKQFPDCFTFYQSFVRKWVDKDMMHSHELLGLTLTWENPDPYGPSIINCFTQDDYWRHTESALYRDRLYVSYDAVYQAFDSIHKYVKPASLAMPKIGAGLGGGDWNIIEAIVESTLVNKGVKVKVYEL